MKVKMFKQHTKIIRRTIVYTKRTPYVAQTKKTKNTKKTKKRKKKKKKRKKRIGKKKC